MRRVITTLLLFIATSTMMSAQSQLAKMAQLLAHKDTTKVYQGFVLGVDMLGAAQAQFTDHGNYEGGVRVSIMDKYFPAIEIGYGTADHTDEFLTEKAYKASAPYFRIGCDYNVLKHKHDPYRLFVGARYAMSSFDYSTTDVEAIRDNQDNLEIIYTPIPDQHATAHWLEAVFGVDAQVWKGFHLGWDLRYKKRLKVKQGDGEVWYVPGMGKNEGTQIWGRFMVMWEF